MRRFAGIELGVDAVPDKTTLCRFRHLLEKYDLTAKIFAEIAASLEEQGLIQKLESSIRSYIRQLAFMNNPG